MGIKKLGMARPIIYLVHPEEGALVKCPKCHADVKVADKKEIEDLVLPPYDLYCRCINGHKIICLSKIERR